MKILKSQSGQVFAEAVLLMVIFSSCVLLASRFFNTNQVFTKLIQGPWNHLQGMTEAGVWAPPAQAKKQHPNTRDRHNTVRGDI